MKPKRGLCPLFLQSSSFLPSSLPSVISLRLGPWQNPRWQDLPLSGQVRLTGMRVDPDELSIVARDVMDLERRLGIDELLEDPLPLVPKFSLSDIGKKMMVSTPPPPRLR